MADAPKSHGRHFGFHGREREFSWLRGMFDAVAAKGADGKYPGPRMAVIVAESGIGKSRLVQELYIRLTNDPQWDPPEVDYWPEAFGDGGVNLRAVPDMKGHVPKGPPRFAWIDARWQSPEERNALARRSVLPEVRSSVMVHAEILKSHGSAWTHAAARVSESVRKEGVGESIGARLDGRRVRSIGALLSRRLGPGFAIGKHRIWQAVSVGSERAISRSSATAQRIGARSLSIAWLTEPLRAIHG